MCSTLLESEQIRLTRVAVTMGRGPLFSNPSLIRRCACRPARRGSHYPILYFISWTRGKSSPIRRQREPKDQTREGGTTALARALVAGQNGVLEPRNFTAGREPMRTLSVLIISERLCRDFAPQARLVDFAEKRP